MTLPRPRPDIVFCAVEDGAVLLNARDEIYYGLNEVGGRIWQLLPPRLERWEELLRMLSETYPDVDVDVLEHDVRELLAQLLEFGLVRQADSCSESDDIEAA